MITQDPPVCSRCRSQPESIPKLEQHVKTSPVEPESIRLPRDLLDGAASVVSISRPLDPKANKIGPTRDGPRWMPPWMALLPSRRTSTNHDSEKSGLSRHSTVPARIARAVPSARLTPLPKPTDSTRGGLEQRPAGTQVPAFLPDAHFDGRDTAAEAVELLNTTPDESMDDGVPAGLFLRRTSLKLKRRYPLRKHSERESNGKSPRSCTPEDISPTNTSLVRELSGFFSDRADKEKLILPSRVGETSTRPKAQIDIGGKETPNVATRNCDRCGADLPDITSRTYPLSKKQQRTCQICEAERTTPGAWT
ncbi:hypothetical protein EDD37DRAFT_38563 [Exophiala viscosa]|uniref:Uncharacterized protein n=1 Tax=Exophiala viscosa TaxID=2486360 RepID=A0AAN6E371_9EURO|nr:hypothetical protein EDD36DRAFT_160212 [Exophiala viscosa]KAI1629142.1 hypothetical protein EDD37DRAFT_38563 [Exophiala viscosa]